MNDVTNKNLCVLSLGAGVQSTTMALMAAQGEFDKMPDCAIFADTQSEPKAVYDHLNWLMSGNVLPFPVHVVGKGSLRDSMFDGYNPVPVYSANGSPGRRQCTKEFKLFPIADEQKRLLGIKGRAPKGTSVEVWIGISTDEASRMKPSTRGWQHNRWPLIEKRMSRSDCLLWMGRNGYPVPPRSACTFCPYHNDREWREMRDLDPVSWADAVEADERLRERGEFLHRSLKPLSEVDLTTVEDEGQINFFNEECEGMCGV
jgi:hypothetical protein